MTSFPCTLMSEAERLPTVGLVVLQADVNNRAGFPANVPG